MKSLRDLIGRTLADTGSAKALTPVWQRVVGELVARHSWPIRWEGQALVVRCDGETWKAVLTGERERLTRSLRDALGNNRLTSLIIEV